MSVPLGNRLPFAWLERLDRLLQRRWIQVGLFLGTFLLFWLLGGKTAHAGGW